MSIYHLIPKDNWITRGELARRSGLSDRMVRREINELRKHPETVIVSSSHGKGYKRPSSVDELLVCLNESKSRVKDELEKQIVLAKAIRDMEEKKTEEQLSFDF